MNNDSIVCTLISFLAYMPPTIQEYINKLVDVKYLVTDLFGKLEYNSRSDCFKGELDTVFINVESKSVYNIFLKQNIILEEWTLRFLF